jgi:hypothetical protein
MKIVPYVSLLVAFCSAAVAVEPSAHKRVGKPAPAASAASGAQPQQRLPSTSPAVRASEESQVPGDLRPENRVVPQVAIPLRRDRVGRSSDAASAGKSGGQIDDSAARRAANRPAGAKK